MKIDFKTNRKILEDVVDGKMKQELNGDRFSSIHLELKDLTSTIHEFAFNPNKGVCEDKLKQEKPEIKDITLII